MNRLLTTLLLAMMMVGSIAQTLNIQQGNVTYAFTASGDDMTFQHTFWTSQ